MRNCISELEARALAGTGSPRGPLPPCPGDPSRIAMYCETLQRFGEDSWLILPAAA